MHVLSERGFVIATNGRIYTTMKGIEFLEKYEELMMMWNFLENRQLSKLGPVIFCNQVRLHALR